LWIACDVGDDLGSGMVSKEEVARPSLKKSKRGDLVGAI